jgi:competence protein ComEC
MSIRRPLRSLFLAFCLAALTAASAAAAPTVHPSERVVNWVNVRQNPGIESPIIGRLRPGESAELIDTVPGWYQVRLANGQTGFVSRGWVQAVEQAAAPAGPTYHLYLIDVGTGLSVLVDGPGFAILYDAGSNDDTALGPRNRVLAYIRHVRPDLTRLDHVILSHPHQDHVALFPDVLTTYEIGNAWDSGRDYKNCQYHAFLRVIRDRNIPYHDADNQSGPHVVDVPAGTCLGHAEPAQQIVVPHAGHIQVGVPVVLGPGAQMTFLRADPKKYASPNENSLIVALDLGRTRILFMGDAQAGGRASPSLPPTASSAEGQLLLCCAANLRSDVLIAGHHGSKTSSRIATLDKIGAYMFLVSSGPKKYSGTSLPDKEIIDEFQRRGSVYRTDVDDAWCEANPAKIGPDADGQPGGCDNVILTIDSVGHLAAAYDRSAD